MGKVSRIAIIGVVAVMAVLGGCTAASTRAQTLGTHASAPTSTSTPPTTDPSSPTTAVPNVIILDFQNSGFSSLGTYSVANQTGTVISSGSFGIGAPGSMGTGGLVVHTTLPTESFYTFTVAGRMDDNVEGTYKDITATSQPFSYAALNAGADGPDWVLFFLGNAYVPSATGDMVFKTG